MARAWVFRKIPPYDKPCKTLELFPQRRVSGCSFPRGSTANERRVQNEKQMLDYVYANYPEYAVKSKLIKHQKEETKPGFFSIGYEGKDIDYFLNLLIIWPISSFINLFSGSRFAFGVSAVSSASTSPSSFSFLKSL